MSETSRRLQRGPGTLERRITRWLARAWPEDEADRTLARMTAEGIGTGDEGAIENARHALDRESAKAVLDRAFTVGNLAAGAILTVTVFTRGVNHGFVAIEALAIIAAQVAGVCL